MKSIYTLRPFAVLAVCLLFAVVAMAAEVPDGFSVTQVATGMTSVTRMELLPDGRILVCEQAGTIHVIENGVRRSTPFLTIDVDSFSEHGLLGITLDPAFATNHFFYVYYTARTPVSHNRVSRFTAGVSADPASEQVIFEMDPSTGELGWHQGGNLSFGPDGKLYVAVGDDRNGANSQSMTTLFGKILRVNSDGSIPTDNPFYASNTGKYRAIWALGLRNPYSFAFSKADGIRMLINDVGEETWEEINRGAAGANYGWPETEGFTSDPRFLSPLVTYGHGYDSDVLGCAVTAGVFYEPSTLQFPSKYSGKFFYADFCNGWIRSLRLSDLSSEIFARFTYFPVDLKLAADGTLYYLERGLDSNVDGAVFKIEYTNQDAPHITTQPANVTVAAGEPASFTVSADGASPLSYQWQRNGVDVTGANSPTLNIAAAQLSDNGATFVCVVSNQFGAVSSQPAQLTVVAGSAPVATITLPTLNTTYRGGDVIQYAGTGTDADDGNLPASAFTWQVVFHHDTHTHPFIPAFSGTTSGQFTIPTTGETATDVWYRIHLTVRDSSGLTHSTFRDITPVVETINLATNPAGLRVNLDDQPQNTPLSVSSVVGVTRTLSTLSPQQLNGQWYEFESWFDGGAATHTIDHGGTYVANFRLAPVQPEVVLYASEGVRVGNYQVVNDATAAGGARLHNPDAGAAKLSSALASPGTYVELQFAAQAGVAYRLWIRGRAQNDDPFNDSVFVQFNDSVDGQGVAKSRIGTSSSEVINLEDCFGCGLSGWGWQDNGWGVGELGPLVYFATSGTHTLWIQPREDGLSIDQVVLSSQAFLTTAPGAVVNDATILAKSSGSSGQAPAPAVGSVTPGTGPTTGGTAVTISGTGFVSGATVRFGAVAAVNVQVVNSTTLTATTPAQAAAGAMAVTVTNADNQSGTLTNAFSYTTPPPTGSAEVVLYASEGVRVGNYQVVNDGTAAGGARLDNPDAGAAKLSSALANPGTYVELQFAAQAGVAYRLWIRGRAQNDDPFNDSVFVQFNDSVDGQGAAKSRIGTSSAEVINLEDCFACGLSGWGWQDNGWGVGELGPLVYFATSGTHTLRIQPREDGLSIDQVVLSPQAFLTTAPGAVVNDTTILAKSSGSSGQAPAPAVGSVTPSTGPTTGGTAVTISGTGFVSDATVKFGGVAAVNVQVVNSTTLTATTPAQAAAGAMAVTVTNADNQSGTLTNAFSYTTPPPTGSAEVVLYASEGVRVGNYQVVNDGTAAGGARLDNPDAGAAKLSSALANPGTYVELQFAAQAGVAYRLWIRGRAQNDDPFNDSVFVQFNDSVDGQGAAKSRIGTSSAEVINLEDCFACGLSGWGWQDNGWGVGELGPLVYFATSGTHTLRIQPREDGLSIDQVVLSPQAFLTTAPGAVVNDTTILSKTGSP